MEPPKKPKIHYLPTASLPNIYKPGSKKHTCFEIFLRGGSRAEMIEWMERTGAAGTTVRTWLTSFRDYARGVREAKKGGAE